MDTNELNLKYDKLEKRIEQLEFRESLMLENSEVSNILLQYNVNQEEYSEIMDVMENMRNKLENGKNVSSAEFETQITNIFGGFVNAGRREPGIDYHFCEYIAKAFWEDARWKEVFPAVYGDSMKYKHLFKENN